MDGSTKLQISNRKINPFGGINFVISEMKKKKMDELIDKQLGKRPKQAQYSYSDVMLSWIYSNLCGAERIEDIQQIKSLFNIPDLKIPSSDRISQIFRSLATKTEIYNSARNVKHQFNIHNSLNILMFDIILKLGMLKKNTTYTLDYDNTVIDCEKYDSESTYLKTKGYQPGICFINKLPVYIENRNGNSSAVCKIKETIERGFNLLESKDISISRFRSDSAACTKEIFKYLDEKPDIEYFIKFHKHKNRNIQVRVSLVRDWEELPSYGIKIGCTHLNFHGENRRFIITKQLDDPDLSNYMGILTNNETMTNKEVYYFYNKRGAIERNFDDLKNNFNWSRLPFSFLNENTVFMLISAVAYIIYQYIINVFSRKVDFVKRNFRLKNFIFQFITVGSEWIGENTLRLYTNKKYNLLI
jgi:hypothetical protein